MCVRMENSNTFWVWHKFGPWWRNCGSKACLFLDAAYQFFDENGHGWLNHLISLFFSQSQFLSLAAYTFLIVYLSPIVLEHTVNEPMVWQACFNVLLKLGKILSAWLSYFS